MPIVLKSGSLNLLEHSGSVQACNGTATAVLYHVLHVSGIHILLEQYVSFDNKKQLNVSLTVHHELAIQNYQRDALTNK